MQASKIVIGDEYAVNYGGKLCILTVTKVVTSRTGKHPSDFAHVVHGNVAVTDGVVDKDYRCGPDQVLGPYTEHRELVERRAAEKAAKDKIEAERTQLASDLVAELYRVTGLKQPASTSWSDPFRASLQRVDISIAGAAILIEILRRLDK